MRSIDDDDLDRSSRIIIGETLAPSVATDDPRLFQYRAVLRVPNRVGKLTLEAVHRGKVIATSPLTVVPAKAASESVLSIEHPALDAVYLASSDIVVSGTTSLSKEQIFFDFLDGEKIVKSYSGVLTGDELNGGRWATRLYFQKNDVRNPGQYQLVARPRHARQQSRSIRIVADPSGAKLPTIVQTKVGSDEYEQLQRLQLPRVTIQNRDSEQPLVIFREKANTTEFETVVGAEFAAEGILEMKSALEKPPSNIIVRLMGQVKDGGGETIRATVNEVLATYDGTDQQNEFNFRAVLRSPNFAGSFSVETLYGRQVISTVTMRAR